MTVLLTTLENVLEAAENLNPSHFLYLPFDEVWGLATKCAVIPESDINGTPKIASENRLEYVVGTAAVQDIVANAAEQLGKANLEQLLQAFLFYYDNDAFIDFDAEGRN